MTPDLALLDAALVGDAALGRLLECDVAAGWVVFPASLQRARVAVAADQASARWGPRFIVLEEPRTLVGWGGFKGAPQHGAVEIGYAIAPGWEGRGMATAAARALVDEASVEPAVRAVLAHTLPGPGASVRVLEKLGFARDGENLDGDVGVVWRWRRALGDA